MALNLDDKKAIVAEVNETAAQALSLVIADARGVDVTAMNALRAKARAENVQLRVVRNTLAKRAFSETNFACVEDVLVGPSLFAFSMLACVTLAPVAKLVRTLNEIPTKATRAVAAVRDAKEAA